MAHEKHELTHQELGQATGAGRTETRGYTTYYYNAKNERIGHCDYPSGPIYYVPCDKCGKPMHWGWYGWYCDPCDRYLCNIHFYEWHGTADELMSY